MSLRAKIGGVLGIVVAVYLALTFAVLRTFIQPAFGHLEDARAASDFARVAYALDHFAEQLHLFNREWSDWNSTQEFLSGSHPSFVEDDLSDFNHDIVDVALLHDPHGRLVWSSAADGILDTPLGLESLFEDPRASLDRLLLDTFTTEGISGLLDTRLGPALVVGRPVRNNAGEGPKAGTLIYVTLLTPTRLDLLRTQTQTRFDLLPHEESALPPGLHWRLLNASGGAIELVSENLRRSYKSLLDVYEQPYLVLQVETARGITQVGSKAVWLSLLSLVVGCSLVAAVIWVALRRLIISPIRALTFSMLAVSQEFDERGAWDEAGDPSPERPAAEAS